MKIPQNLGMLCLSIWLIAQGVFPILHLRFMGDEFLLSLLAIATGVLLILRK